MSNIDVVIMAAGKGTRMQSSMPKVLHRLGGRALLQHVIDTAKHIQARRMVVITGHGAEQVESVLEAQSGLQSVRQMPQLGTGHAMQQAVPVLQDDGVTLVLSGDVPLIQADTLLALLKLCDHRHLALLTLQTPAPGGYGRILRNPQQQVSGIVEEKDASDEQKKISEIYSGIMAVPTRLLRGWLARLGNRNAQGEFYLTDVVGFAAADGCEVRAHCITQAWQVEGVNTPVQLAALERTFQLLQAQSLMRQGVRLADPARLDVRGELFGGVGDCFGAVGGETFLDVGPRQYLDDVRMQFGNDVARHGRLCQYAVPLVGVITGHTAFVDGGDVRHDRQPFHRRHAEQF